jgi:hypothetical protein
MAIFPATQYHYVRPYSGIGNRISIAFNLHHPDFRVLYYEGMQEPSWWWRNFRGFAILPSKVPEKIHGLSLLCGLLLQERRPRGAGWREHLSVLMDRAFAEASARQEHARAAAAEQYPQA